MEGIRTRRCIVLITTIYMLLSAVPIIPFIEYNGIPNRLVSSIRRQQTCRNQGICVASPTIKLIYTLRSVILYTTSYYTTVVNEYTRGFRNSGLIGVNESTSASQWRVRLKQPC